MRTKFPKKIVIDVHCMIGLDFSIQAPAVSISFKKNTDIINRVFNFPKAELEKTERWDNIADTIVAYLNATVVLRNSIVMLEDYAMGGKGRTNDIAEATGLLKYKLLKAGLPTDKMKLVAITHVKQFVTGKGTSKKDVMLKEVFKKWNFDTNDDNLADAFSIMKICRSYCGIKEPISDFQRTIISKVKIYNKVN